MFGCQFGVFVYVLYVGNFDLVVLVMKDVIVEFYRKLLLLGFDEVCVFSEEIGVLVFGIFGLGLMVFVVCLLKVQVEKVVVYLIENYIQNEDGFSYVC